MPTFPIWILIASSLSAAPEVPEKSQSPSAQEQWVNPGVRVPPSTDLTKFVKDIDGAFVGTLERVSTMFLDDRNAGTLHTVLTFRVSEWLFQTTPLTANPRVEVLVHGGTFVEEGGKLIPKQPEEGTQQLQPGAEYFVPLQNGARFGREGRLLLGSSSAMARLEAGRVSSAMRGAKWPEEVIAGARTTSATPGPSPSARAIFLSAVRKAGKEKK